MSKSEAIQLLIDVAREEAMARWDLAQTLAERDEAQDFENAVEEAVEFILRS